MLTQTGRMMRSIPAHPRIARMLVEASRLGVRFEAAEVAALLLDGPNTASVVSDDVGDADILSWHRVEVQRGAFRRGRPLGRLSRRLANGAKARGGAEHIGPDLCRCLFVGWPDQLSRRAELKDPALTLVGGRKGRHVARK